MSDDDGLMLSGWCSPTDQYHKGCRWELCQCPAHVANPALNKAKVGRSEYNEDVQREPDRANDSDSLATVSTTPKGA